jgi:alpha-tubulin N-acetyltransferase 1
MKYQGSRCIGILKIGQKKLFIQNRIGQTIEITPTCVLDFYVHETVQRGGHGRHLFETMLNNQNVSPSNIAYDRPSDKFKSFL